LGVGSATKRRAVLALADELARAGHEVTARNRDETTDDPVLSVLNTLDYDQLWLTAVDTGHNHPGGRARQTASM
jgi:hypothetical protein